MMNIILEGHDLTITNEIIERADQLDLLFQDKVSLLKDLNVAHSHYSLRLNDLLQADNESFAYDVTGIQRYIDRESNTFSNDFLPHYKTFAHK